ncbi:MAG: hypothetical protein KGZ85_12665 [Ignavibacterium sp.]|nr:hypothetical protein [Ignavibacterium sp.]
MKPLKQKLQSLLNIAFLSTAILTFGACSEENDPISPEIANISGKWDGTIDHPGYDSGTISFQILQNDDNINGSFSMRLVKSNGAENYGGTLSGAKTGNNKYSVTLTGTNFTWISDLTLNSVTLSGGWESSRNSLSGSISVKKD